MNNVDCIVPAAGCSKRMGAWKLVLPFRGNSIVETVVDTALSVCDRVILVAGYRGCELREMFAGRSRIHIETNPDWNRGMFSSIQCGILHVRSDRFFVVPADMPLISRETYKMLLNAPECDVIFPVFGSRRGHPVLFQSFVADAVLQENSITGRMREVSERFEVCEVACNDESVLIDFDTMEDYRQGSSVS